MVLYNKELCAELIISKAQGKLTENALLILKTLTKRIIGKYIKNSDDRSDCFCSTYCDILKYWRYFNEEKSNDAFGFFIYLIKRSLFWGPVEKNYKGHKIKLISIDGTGLYPI